MCIRDRSRVAAERRPPTIRYKAYHCSPVVEGGRPFIMVTRCIISLRVQSSVEASPHIGSLHWMLNSAMVIELRHTWQIHFD